MHHSTRASMQAAAQEFQEQFSTGSPGDANATPGSHDLADSHHYMFPQHINISDGEYSV